MAHKNITLSQLKKKSQLVFFSKFKKKKKSKTQWLPVFKMSPVLCKKKTIIKCCLQQVRQSWLPTSSILQLTVYMGNVGNTL